MFDFDRRHAELLTAVMQFVLSLVFVGGFFYVTDLVLTGEAKVPRDQLRLADMLFGSLTTILTVIAGYWFSRQRGQSKDPAEQNPPRQPVPPG